MLVNYHDTGRLDVDHCRRFWEIVAGRYADWANVFYELANEPVPWCPCDWDEDALAAQQSLLATIRDRAPETHVVLCSFANTNDEYKPMVAVVDALDVDWSNASVGFHCYQTGGTSAPIVATRERYPVICTEVDVPVSAGGDANVVAMDGEDWPTQTLERLGISWFAWRANGPEELERHFRGGFLAAAKRGRLRLDGEHVNDRSLQARALLQRAVLRANGVRGLRRVNAVPYAIALRLLGRLCERTDGVRGAFVRSGMARHGWTPGLSDVDLLVVLDDGSPAEERRAALAFTRSYERLRRGLPMLGELEIVATRDLDARTAHGVDAGVAASWPRLGDPPAPHAAEGAASSNGLRRFAPIATTSFPGAGPGETAIRAPRSFVGGRTRSCCGRSVVRRLPARTTGRQPS